MTMTMLKDMPKVSYKPGKDKTWKLCFSGQVEKKKKTRLFTISYQEQRKKNNFKFYASVLLKFTHSILNADHPKKIFSKDSPSETFYNFLFLFTFHPKFFLSK